MRKATKAEWKRVLTAKIRDLQTALRAMDQHCGYVDDLVVDAQCLLRAEQPIDADILDAFRRFERGPSPDPSLFREARVP